MKMYTGTAACAIVTMSRSEADINDIDRLSGNIRMKLTFFLNIHCNIPDVKKFLHYFS
jgi:hypothetical protein